MLGLLAASALILTICLALLSPVLYVLNLCKLTKVEYTVLELTPPLKYAISNDATLQFYNIVHRIYLTQSRRDKLLRGYYVLALEINSSRENGIRFRARVPLHLVANFKQSVVSLVPGVRIRSVKDSLPNFFDQNSFARILEFKLGNHFSNKIRTLDEFKDSDPMAFLMGALSAPEKGEFYSFQILLSPARNLNESKQLNKLYGGDRFNNMSLLKKSLYIPINILGLSAAFCVGVFKVLQGTNNLRELHARSYKIDSTLPYFDKDIDLKISKLTQPLFYTDMRLLLCAKSSTNLNNRVSAFSSSLSVFDRHGSQGLVEKKDSIISFWRKSREFKLYKFIKRLPSLDTKKCNVLCLEEVASIFHFPYTELDEKITRSFGKSLPTSANNKRRVDENKLNVILGKNDHNGVDTPLGLTSDERQRHVYIIGGTGNGKTTMMQYAVVQDIQNGNGVAVIDPHGDMAEFLLSHIPKKRIKDVVYFNPDDISYPVGMNLLEMRKTKNDDELLREKDLVTESVISIFRKIFSESDSGGHRIEYILRNAIQTALTINDATLFTVFNLLNDPVFRKGVVKDLGDKNLKNFWWHELGKAGDMQKVKLSVGITSKIGRFLFSATAKRVLEQPRSTIDFDDIVDSGKILICNFSKGLLGEDTSQLFGTTVLAKLQIASLHRARLNQSDRLPFYIYVDEFQNFATPSFIQLLSEARKYKFFMTLAEQSTSQQPNQKMVNTILANVGTIVCFRTANPEDERLILPLFNSYIKQGDIANLPAYNFYMRQAAINVQEPVSGKTLLVSETANGASLRSIVKSSRRNYAIKYLDKLKSVNVDKSPIQDKRVYEVPQSA